eukprot:gb/GEZN01008579.1/.p1 GENE.gb/GEZN01008579.1/~~gb/GEZN01008579.1/.p1  ORF type:complete len:467 (-),score=30.04 gb/GEZN01008579.1/:11-1378(-)
MLVSQVVVLRNTLVYAGSLLGFMFVCRDGIVTWQESLTLIACFVGYLAIIYVCSFFYTPRSLESPCRSDMRGPGGSAFRTFPLEEEDPLLVEDSDLEGSLSGTLPVRKDRFSPISTTDYMSTRGLLNSSLESDAETGASTIDRTSFSNGRVKTIDEHDEDVLMKMSAEELDRLVDQDLLMNHTILERAASSSTPRGLNGYVRYRETGMYPSAEAWNKNDRISTSRLSSPSGMVFHILSAMALPYNCIFSVTIPGGRSLWVLTIVVALIYIGLLSQCILLMMEQICQRFNMQPHFAGATILALGSQIPNTFASMTMARRGYGRQIINILIGANLPFFLSALVRGEPVVVDWDQIDFTATAILLVIALFLILTLCKPLQAAGGREREDFGVTSDCDDQLVGLAGQQPLYRSSRRCSPALDKTSANTLLSVYGLVLVALILRDFISNFQPPIMFLMSN